YLLTGVRSPGVAGLLDFFARRETGFEDELMLALSRQDDGDERLLAIATDRGVGARQRDAAVAYLHASMTFHRSRAVSILEGVAAVWAAWDGWVRTRPIPPPPQRRPTVRTAPRIGRNEPCPCGSGKKHKQCCLGHEPAQVAPPAPMAEAPPADAAPAP